MPATPFHIYEVGDLRFGPVKVETMVIKEVLEYAKARWHQAVLAIANAPSGKQVWMQRALADEMVCILTLDLTEC